MIRHLRLSELKQFPVLQYLSTSPCASGKIAFFTPQNAIIVPIFAQFRTSLQIILNSYHGLTPCSLILEKHIDLDTICLLYLIIDLLGFHSSPIISKTFDFA